MSSLRQEQHEIQHFTHSHSLRKIDGFGEFTCGCCKTYGVGKTYRCVRCDYNLHDHCATCPDTLISFMHPQHELQLVVFKKPEHTHKYRRICDICYEPVEGLFYECKPCGFNVHPLCAKLPQHVKHGPHPDHLLKLSHEGASNKCMVCHGAIQSWRYTCGPCRLDIHMECVDSSASSQPHFHNQGGHTNQGQVPGIGPRMRKTMFKILLNIVVGVVCNMIGVPDFLHDTDFFPDIF